jgi:hypothetical protein
MAKRYGKCALCGQECELTFEHIPPRGAFNSTPARPVSGTELFKESTLNDDSRMPWDTSGLRYDNQQQGMGRYSLCQNCNNNTGSWYGDMYVTFAHTVHTAIQNRKPDDPDGIGFKEVYPLRLIKQILSMFCSITNPSDSKMDDIRKFVLDKDAVGIDKTKYKLCLYFTNSTVMKYSGVMVVLRGNLSQPESMALAEITAYPLGFILHFNPTETWDYKGTDITECADYHYNEKCDIIFPWTIKEMNDIFPESFRSREEIKACIEKNRQFIDQLDAP